MSVQFPEIRKQIVFMTEDIFCADECSDSKPQGVALAAEFFLDTWDLDRPSEQLVGIYLENNEVESVRILAQLLLNLVQEHGWELSSAEFSSKAEWPAVKNAAQIVLQTIKCSNLY